MIRTYGTASVTVTSPSAFALHIVLPPVPQAQLDTPLQAAGRGVQV